MKVKPAAYNLGVPMLYVLLFNLGHGVFVICGSVITSCSLLVIATGSC
jgi:hypothetical protein